MGGQLKHKGGRETGGRLKAERCCEVMTLTEAAANVASLCEENLEQMVLSLRCLFVPRQMVTISH